MIPWLFVAPTPQFAPVLNRIQSERPDLAVRAYYLDLGDRQRGWGDIEVRHAAEEMPSGLLQRIVRGFWVGASSSTDPIVVLGYSNPFSAAALLGARLRGRRVFTQSDSSLRLETSSGLRRVVKWGLLRALFGKDARAWVISDDNANYWSSYGVRDQVRVSFESPVDVDEELDHASLALRQRLGLEESHPVVLSVCRVSREKGIDEAVAAIELLAREGLEARLVVVGKLQQGYVAPVSRRTIFAGPIQHAELGAAYKLADVFVLCSHAEPYGLAVREALQFGLPVVATSGVPAAIALCDEGWNIVPPGDAQSLAKALRTALEGPRWSEQEPLDLVPFYVAQIDSALRRSSA